MRNYLLHMMTYEPCKTMQRECDIAIIIFFKTGLTNIMGERNHKSVYEGYTDMYVFCHTRLLVKMQLLVARMCSEYMWSLLTSCRLRVELPDP